jgi:hypothetical protein
MLNHETHPISIVQEIRNQRMEELCEAKIRLEKIRNTPEELGQLPADEITDLELLPKQIAELEETLGLNKKAA